MSNIKYILGSFGDPDEMMHGIEKLQENNIKIHDVYTPMPIHGIEAKLGIKRSRLDILAFFCGITGTVSAFALIYLTSVVDWRHNIGGKPAFALPDFIPIMFEVTILFCAFGLVGSYYASTHLFPGRAPRVMDLRATDDRFIIAVDAQENGDHSKIDGLLKEAGAIEVKHNERKYISYE
ncbi:MULTISPECIES: DUF3341 domain-containing protein [Pedobacter]|jgi:hypothetical protein|uniref:Quinol:cytochrome C oxidoreductase n=1 Tax=Pedobacter cryoconitis TaxID=188932 RepID=A0A127VH89_9SPHI|nr:DUF3341 domain-containing protein [Pedobacter cryoconitis]AMQ00697.1 Quinol:cytochrome C oxidoreductase [Pedobacter cryoconitis]MBB5620074.1 hypothetical protein [Pedobacter cryoconitis]MBB5648225.1 hypothetical protein [Pedobacter cryoconitis]RAJ29797.1 quinol:cytochrome c oxidoreductase membrane protein [Pedobacter cryoconitis]